jgi:thiamine biosynthesis lipoprotein
LLQIEGHQVSHIVDPRIGLPVQTGAGMSELGSVSVIAPNCTRADALATAFFVLGERQGIELANQHGIAVLFLLRTGNEIREVASQHWAEQQKTK